MDFLEITEDECETFEQAVEALKYSVKNEKTQEHSFVKLLSRNEELNENI